MDDVIRELSLRPGVRGALVMTADGVLVGAEIGPELDSQAVSALATGVAARARAAAAALGIGSVRRATLSASFGRLVLVPFDELVLVAVTEPWMALDQTLLEIAGPARRIHQLATNW